MKPQEFRKEKQEAYTRLMLRYLSHHGYTTVKILQDFFALKDAKSVRSKLESWTKAGFIERVEVQNPIGGRANLVYKLTPHGQAFARSIGADPREEVKISHSGLEHSLFMQRVNIALLKRGYYGFETDRQIAGAIEKYGHYPDFVCFNKHSKRVVVEAERTIKSRSRYQQIMADLVNAWKNGHLDGVFYIVPDDRTRTALINTIQSAVSKPFERKGHKMTLSIDDLTKFIKFHTIDEIEAVSGHFMRFHGFHAPELRSFCMVHFAGLMEGKKVVIIETLGANPWTSTTNVMEEVAPAALKMLNEEQGQPNGFKWKSDEVLFIEHWNGQNSLAGDDAFIPVFFEGEGFTDPQWGYNLSKESKEQLRHWLF